MGIFRRNTFFLSFSYFEAYKLTLKQFLQVNVWFQYFFRLPLEAPVVVIGDRSGSMDVAIRTSTIIAALLAAIVQAKLVFFNNENMDAKSIPKTITEVSH